MSALYAHYKPGTGSPSAYMPLGNASVLVEYEIIDDVAQVLACQVNGKWIDPQDFFAESVFDNWQSELTRAYCEDKKVTAAKKREAARQAARDLFFLSTEFVHGEMLAA